jgi:hypothetical protein
MLWLEPDRLSAIVHIVKNVLAGDTKVQMIANSNRLNVGLLNLGMLLLINLAMQMDPTADPLEVSRKSCDALRSAFPRGSGALITRRGRVCRGLGLEGPGPHPVKKIGPPGPRGWSAAAAVAGQTGRDDVGGVEPRTSSAARMSGAIGSTRTPPRLLTGPRTSRPLTRTRLARTATRYG